MGYGYVVAGLIALAVIAGAGVKGYFLGREAREPEIVEMRLAIATAEAAAADAAIRGKAAAARAQAQYAAKAKVIRVEAENTRPIVEVIRRESVDCVVPPAFVGLWNGDAVDSAPGSAPGVNAAATGVADAEAKRKPR